MEAHIVQLNANGGFSLTHRKLYSQTAKEFDAYLDDSDYKLIKLLDQLDQEYIIKKYHKEPIRPAAYFSKIWNEKLYAIVRPILEKKLVDILPKLLEKLVKKSISDKDHEAIIRQQLEELQYTDLWK